MTTKTITNNRYMKVKVQQGLNNNNILVYNKDKSIFYEGKMPKKVKKIMGNRLKVYFDAQMVGSKISLNCPTSDQDW